MRNVSWTFLSNLIYAATQWLIIVLLAKLATVEVVGIYAMALAVVAPIMALANGNMRTLQVIDREKKHILADYVGYKICIGFMAGSLVVVFSKVISNSFEVFLVSLAIFFARWVESLSDVIHGEFHCNEKLDLISKSIIIRSVLQFVLIGLVYVKSKSLPMALAGSVVVSLMVFALYDLKNRNKYSDGKIAELIPKFNSVMSLFLMAFPMTVIVGVVVIYGNVPRYVLSLYENEESVGYFSSVAYFLVVGTTVIGAIGQAALPKLKNYFDSDVASFKRLSKKIQFLSFFVGGAGFLITMVIGDVILRMVYSQEYGEYAQLFNCIMLAAVFAYWSSMQGVVLTAANYIRPQVVTNIVLLVLLLLACIILVPMYSLMGCGFALIFVGVCKCLIQIFQIRALRNENTCLH